MDEMDDYSAPISVLVVFLVMILAIGGLLVWQSIVSFASGGTNGIGIGVFLIVLSSIPFATFAYGIYSLHSNGWRS